MNDRDLLELAAKAAGMVDWRWYAPSNCLCHYNVKMGRWYGDHYNDKFEWNPLNDDGDALRLAVKLKMGISIPVHRTIKADVVCFLDSEVSIREEGDDPYAATRRAIVRAAAEIGKSM